MDKNEELLSELKYLKLKSFVDYMDEVESSNLSLRDSLLELCRHEVRRRHDNSVLRRIKLAGFPKTKGTKPQEKVKIFLISSSSFN